MILINTLPKSGSVYISTMLAAGLGKLRSHITMLGSDFPRSVIDHERLSYIATSEEVTYVVQEHLAASPQNIAALKQSFPRMVVHVRDPRQAMLSFTHHYRRRANPEYLALDLSQQIDYQINHYYVDAIQWIEGWLDVHDIEILFTTYEHFHTRGFEYIRDVLDFYSIPMEDFQWNAPKKSSKYHFRFGEVDEWRRVFTASQQKVVSELLPDRLSQRFGWNKEC